jgi:hypothetical protein
MYNGVMDKKAQILQRILEIELQLKNNVAVSTYSQLHRVNELQRMMANIRLMYEDLDRESVECRRLGKETAKYSEHYTKLSDGLDLLEQLVMTAIMMA